MRYINPRLTLIYIDYDTAFADQNPSCQRRLNANRVLGSRIWCWGSGSEFKACVGPFTSVTATTLIKYALNLRRMSGIMLGTLKIRVMNMREIRNTESRDCVNIINYEMYRISCAVTLNDSGGIKPTPVLPDCQCASARQHSTYKQRCGVFMQICAAVMGIENSYTTAVNY